ncbi:hypothetical protein [Candidatus Tisiphia endosymbiont of Sialis lutaria]|uniref:hypothetical protein n=1 Tax=Candidatus Tisiphia endosymbiont of Sialis lutaria TaxID=2029164 RepID=UPI00312CA97C
MIKKYLFLLLGVCIFEVVFLQCYELPTLFQFLYILLTICIFIISRIHFYYIKDKKKRVQHILSFFVKIVTFICIWLGVIIIFIIVDIYEQKPLNWYQYSKTSLKLIPIFIGVIILCTVELVRDLSKLDKTSLK